MNRTILNFEATVSSAGLDLKHGQDLYVVRLYMNHHIVKTWTLPQREGYLLTQDRARLDEFVASRVWEILNPVTVTYVSP